MSPENQENVTGSAGAVQAVAGSEVPGSAKMVLGVAVPDTVDGILEALKEIDVLAEKTTAVCWWAVGELLFQLEQRGEDAEQVVTARTRHKKRALRYAKSVRRTFTQERVIRLTDMGLMWTTLRELAGDALEPHRGHLLALFEHGRITDVELRQQAFALRRQPQGADDSDGREGPDDDAGDDGRLIRVADGLTADARKLERRIVEAASGFRDRLADALISDDGTPDEKAEERVVAMNVAMQKLVVEAVELIFRTGNQIVMSGFPLEELADRIAVLRQDFEAEAQASRVDGAQSA